MKFKAIVYLKNGVIIDKQWSVSIDKTKGKYEYELSKNNISTAFEKQENGLLFFDTLMLRFEDVSAVDFSYIDEE